MTERELKLLLDANAIKRETRKFKTLDTAAKFLFKIGVADFAMKLQTNVR